MNHNSETTDLQLLFNEKGLIPVVVSDYLTREVQMLAYMNEESFTRTMNTGYAVYYSRSRKRLWKKGEESGCLQQVQEIKVDCDQDSLLLYVKTEGSGANCHTGRKSCFYRKIVKINNTVKLEYSNGKKLHNPDTVYKTN